MGAAAMRAEDVETLRQGLRRMTGALHDVLDRTLGAAALDGPAGYAAFLATQYAARCGIEAWAGAALPRGLRPPAVAHLIAQDLAALGEPSPPAMPFRFPDGAHPLGLAWALGGSALGNRAMLARLREAGIAKGTRFLSDRALARYFTGLLPELEQPAAPELLEAAGSAAEAVFETFLRAARDPILEQAA